MTGRAVLTAIGPSGVRRYRIRLLRGHRLLSAPAASDRLVPARSATPPAAWRRPRPDAEIAYGGEDSLASSSLICARVNARGRAMRAWIDRTNDGLSGMPADGISLPPKKGGLRHVPLGGSKVRLHQPRDWAEGACACGTPRRFAAVPMFGRY